MRYIATAFQSSFVEVSVFGSLSEAKNWGRQKIRKSQNSKVVFIERLTQEKIDVVVQAERDMRYDIEAGRRKCLYIWDAVKEFVDAIEGYLFWERRGW